MDNWLRFGTSEIKLFEAAERFLGVPMNKGLVRNMRQEIVQLGFKLREAAICAVAESLRETVEELCTVDSETTVPNSLNLSGSFEVYRRD